MNVVTCQPAINFVHQILSTFFLKLRIKKNNRNIENKLIIKLDWHKIFNRHGSVANLFFIAA
jgi:hypothetical protein